MSQVPPQSPLPVVPIAAGPDWAAHVAEIERTRRRPGIVTAVGVASVVVASVGILANLGFMLAAFGLYGMVMASQAMSVMAASAAAAQNNAATYHSNYYVHGSPPATMAPPTADPAGPRGLPAAQRQNVTTAFLMLHPVNIERQHQLDALLAQAGQDMMTITDPADIGALQRTVSTYGTGLSSSSGPGPDYFVTDRGHIDLYDDHAVFFPADGSPPVRYMAPATVPAAQANPAAMIAINKPTPPPGRINPNPMLAGFIEGLVSEALMIYLLVAGILTLRHSFRGRTLHRIFALVKIPLALAGGAAWCWLIWWSSDAHYQIAPNNGSPPDLDSILIGCAVGTVVLLIYPVTLLIILGTKAVRNYYNQIPG